MLFFFLIMTFLALQLRLNSRCSKDSGKWGVLWGKPSVCLRGVLNTVSFVPLGNTHRQQPFHHRPAHSRSSCTLPPNGKTMKKMTFWYSVSQFLRLFYYVTNDYDQIDTMYKKCSTNIISLFLWVLNFHARVAVHSVLNQLSSSLLSLNQ